MRTRIKSGWDHPLGITPYEVRERLRRAAMGSDAASRDTAFRLFRSLNDRGSLLFIRRQGGEPAEQARRLLLEINSASN